MVDRNCSDMLMTQRTQCDKARVGGSDITHRSQGLTSLCLIRLWWHSRLSFRFAQNYWEKERKRIVQAISEMETLLPRLDELGNLIQQIEVSYFENFFAPAAFDSSSSWSFNFSPERKLTFCWKLVTVKQKAFFCCVTRRRNEGFLVYVDRSDG